MKNVAILFLVHYTHALLSFFFFFFFLIICLGFWIFYLSLHNVIFFICTQSRYTVRICYSVGDVCIQFMYLNSQCFFYHINVQAVVLNSCGHLIWKSQMPVILVMLELLERSIVLELSAVWLIKGPLRVVTDLTCFSITRHGMAEILLNEFCTPLATV